MSGTEAGVLLQGLAVHFCGFGVAGLEVAPGATLDEEAGALSEAGFFKLELDVFELLVCFRREGPGHHFSIAGIGDVYFADGAEAGEGI